MVIKTILLFCFKFDNSLFYNKQYYFIETGRIFEELKICIHTEDAKKLLKPFFIYYDLFALAKYHISRFIWHKFCTKSKSLLQK